MPTLSINGIEKWQHYKRRNPPWIKLYNSIFNDYKFSRLTDCQKFHLISLWSLASVMDNSLPDDAEWLSARVGARTKIDIDAFISLGFINRENEENAA